MTNQHTIDYSTLPPIVAVDFDGTLVSDDFPNIGTEKMEMCVAIRKLQRLRVKTILWTSRTGKELEEAVQWCEEHKLYFDAVNSNIPEVIELAGTDTRKIYADCYIDDKSFPAEGRAVHEKIAGFAQWLGK